MKMEMCDLIGKSYSVSECHIACKHIFFYSFISYWWCSLRQIKMLCIIRKRNLSMAHICCQQCTDSVFERTHQNIWLIDAISLVVVVHFLSRFYWNWIDAQLSSCKNILPYQSITSTHAQKQKRKRKCVCAAWSYVMIIYERVTVVRKLINLDEQRNQPLWFKHRMIWLSNVAYINIEVIEKMAWNCVSQHVTSNIYIE